MWFFPQVMGTLSGIQHEGARQREEVAHAKETVGWEESHRATWPDEREGVPWDRVLLWIGLMVLLAGICLSVLGGCDPAVAGRGVGRSRRHRRHSREVRAAREYYDALVRAGFSREDALRLTEARVRRPLRKTDCGISDPFSDQSSFLGD